MRWAFSPENDLSIAKKLIQAQPMPTCDAKLHRKGGEHRPGPVKLSSILHECQEISAFGAYDGKGGKISRRTGLHDLGILLEGVDL